MRRVLAWSLVVPLVLAGSQVAHALVYRWVYPSAGVRSHELLATGHGYLSWLPVALALAGAAGLASLAASAVDAARGRCVRSLPAWAFGLLPPVAFALQEVLERSVHSGTFVWQAVESPTFLPGLALQVPFAAAALVTARLLLRTATAVGRLLATRRTPRPGRRVGVLRRPATVHLPRLVPLAAAAAGRAPPRFAT